MAKKPFHVSEVFPEIGWVHDDTLREKVIAVWERMYAESKWEDVMDLPCSTHKTDYPHVIHNRCVVKMAISMADILSEFHGVQINRDYLIAAALLQDSSKLVEYQPDSEHGCVLSELGKTFSHAFYAGSVAMQEGIPLEVVQAINTHSPDAAVYPPSLIAKILFYVDQADMAAIKGDRWKKTVYIYR